MSIKKKNELIKDKLIRRLVFSSIEICLLYICFKFLSLKVRKYMVRYRGYCIEFYNNGKV